MLKEYRVVKRGTLNEYSIQVKIESSNWTLIDCS